MSLQEDLQGVKAQLDAEEKFLESQVKAERFVKKYKGVLIGALFAIVTAAAGYGGWHAWQDHQNEKANEALAILQSNPADTQALGQLEHANHDLFAAFKLQQALAKRDVKLLEEVAAMKIDVISDIASYHAASLQGGVKLQQYSALGDAIYKDLSLLTLASEAIEHNQTKKASQILSRIPMTSPLKEFSGYLEHYTIKGQ